MQLSVAAYPSDTLLEFKTDYCTGFFNGTWKHCCYKHDLHYWFGGTRQEEKLADLRLKQCVANASNDIYAFFIYHSVRLGHYSPLKLSTSWGWGWSKKKNYSPLSSLQKQQLNDRLKMMGITEKLNL
jgi:hypothetical protein